MKSNGIIWNPSFQADKQQRFEKAQKLVDSEVLRRSDPYVPFRSGILKKSGIAGTVIGSGEIKYIGSGGIKYIAPYARKQYYENAGRGIEGLNASGGITGLRGKLWFERMKADQKEDILKQVKEIFK